MSLQELIEKQGGEIIFESYNYIKFSPHSCPIKVRSVFAKDGNCYYREVDGNEFLIHQSTRKDINIRLSIIQKLKQLGYEVVQ